MIVYLVPKNDDSNVLIHHGILGQKWGVRRFQNKDGSLTEEGKKRYSSGGEVHKKFDKEVYHENKKAARLANPKEAQKEFDKFAEIWTDDVDTFNARPKSDIDFMREFGRELENTCGIYDSSFATGEKSKDAIDKYNSFWDKADQKIDELRKQANELYPITMDMNWKDESKAWDKQQDWIQSNPEYQSIYKQSDKLKQKMYSANLNDMGFQDTKKNREFIDYYRRSL